MDASRDKLVDDGVARDDAVVPSGKAVYRAHPPVLSASNPTATMNWVNFRMIYNPT